MQVIDGIANLTLANGLVRIQTIETGPDGEQRAGEAIAIPASVYGAVVQALQQGGQRLQEQQQERAQGEAGATGSASSTAADDAASEKVDFSNL